MSARAQVAALRRLRVELDRTLRGRAFHARAVRGQLRAEEYADLVAQLAALVAAGAGDGCALAPLARGDAATLGTAASPRRPGPAARWVRRALRCAPASVPARDLVLAAAGTSWVDDAAEAAARRFPGAARFLEGLARGSRGALERVVASLEAEAAPGAVAGRRSPAAELLILAELARGAVLGLAAQLDHDWPAPHLAFAGGAPAEEDP